MTVAHCAAMLVRASCVIALGGCTTIHVHSDAGVETKSTFGVVNIKFPEGSRAIVAETSGVGFIVGQRRATIGWMNESIVSISGSSRCQVVFLSPTRADAQAVRAVFEEAGRDMGNMCFFTKGGE